MIHMFACLCHVTPPTTTTGSSARLGDVSRADWPIALFRAYASMHGGQLAHSLVKSFIHEVPAQGAPPRPSSTHSGRCVHASQIVHSKHREISPFSDPRQGLPTKPDIYEFLGEVQRVISAPFLDIGEIIPNPALHNGEGALRCQHEITFSRPRG